MSSHSPIHFPTFQWTCPFSHLQCFPTFPSFQSAPIPSFLFLLFNNLPFPYSLSYFSYLWINSNSPTHFPTFQWAPHSPISFLTFSTFQRAPIPESIFQPFNELPFPHLFSYFCYLSMSSHSVMRNFFFFFISYFSYWIHFLTFPTFSISSPSAIHFSTFHTFQWAPIPLFIFLVFLPFIELPFPYSFSYFSYRTFQ